MPPDPTRQAAIDRPLPLRARADLVTAEEWFGSQRWTVIKDPLTLAFAYLTEQEDFILRRLDCRTSLAEIQEAFARRFAPRQVTANELQSYLAALHKSGLLLSDLPLQDEQFAARRAGGGRFELLRWLERVLALRWRGFNPEPLLARLDPLFGWLFSLPGFALWLAVVGCAAGLLGLHFEEAVERVPDAAAWLAGENLIWLGVAVIFVKTLHELGHALAARRAGAPAREIGVQLFFLLPCLYTNVSDVWLVSGRWRRMLVSAAGMYVELLLAALAAIVWWLAEPGILASLCLNILLFASLGTLLLNGNPLMRYDGYYLLSDWLEIPNLEQRSRSHLVAYTARFLAGIDWQPPDELEARPRPFLAAYAAAAIVYRLAVLVGIYLALGAVLAPHGLVPAADVLATGAILGLLVPLAATVSQVAAQTRRRGEPRPSRLAISVGAFGLVAAAILLLPLPQRVTAPATIEPHAAKRVYATVAGRLIAAKPVGAAVKRGDEIVRLENPELERDLARLASQERQQSLHLAELEALRGDDPTRSAAIPAARQAVADLAARIEQLRELIDRLAIAAPQDGVLLPPPRIERAATDRALAGWSGSPLDSENLGAGIDTGTLLAIVATPGDTEAIAIIDQASAALVGPGSPVKVAAAQSLYGPVRGRVSQIAQIDAAELPPNLIAAGMIQKRRDASGSVRPLATSYQVRIELIDPPATLLKGATGRARIAARRQSLAARIQRWLAQTFRFQMP